MWCFTALQIYAPGCSRKITLRGNLPADIIRAGEILVYFVCCFTDTSVWFDFVRSLPHSKAKRVRWKRVFTKCTKSTPNSSWGKINSKPRIRNWYWRKKTCKVGTMENIDDWILAWSPKSSEIHLPSAISVPLPGWCAIQHTTEPVPSPERRVGVRKGIWP